MTWKDYITNLDLYCTVMTTFGVVVAVVAFYLGNTTTGECGAWIAGVAFGTLILKKVFLYLNV